jgi:hypothetical protein
VHGFLDVDDRFLDGCLWLTFVELVQVPAREATLDLVFLLSWYKSRFGSDFPGLHSSCERLFSLENKSAASSDVGFSTRNNGFGQSDGGTND